MTITSFDGTKIAAHWFPGKGVLAGKPAPSHTKKKNATSGSTAASRRRAEP